MKWILKTDTLAVSDEKHLNNFIKYLFSKSKKHSENDLTRYNAFIYRDGDKLVRGFNREPKQAMSDFKQVLKRSGYTYNDFTMTVNYVTYAFRKNRVLYSNLFESSDDMNNLTPKLDKHTFTYIANEYFDGDLERFGAEINRLLRGAEKNKDFDILNDTVREAITSTYVEQVASSNTFFAIVHVDQNDMLHVHTLDLAQGH
ncbi:hypothetical protein H5404_18160 [Vibrio parahaemolyticus]|uniref:hypothetical protein n=1 Tax=Vibrio parahaemolyticus TaxID=670 RepID=UPI00162756E2|nr:hypothetical protein [Vibrio parahaemolyticus]QNE57746.1 hypothetical protein H5404_18160 [Vibrio parahaemolyticus]